MTRSVEALVDEQARRWQLLRKERAGEVKRPVITLARQHGARGTELAHHLGQKLGLDVFDQEIIHRIAESTHLSERVVSALDERDRALLTDWLGAVATQAYLSPVEYRYHLTRLVGAIAQQGGAVIVGRGSHLILGDRALRVLAVAPLEYRVRTIMEKGGLSERQARQRIVEVETDRRAFMMKQFHAQFHEPTEFDLVVNTGSLGIEGAAHVVRSALEVRRAGAVVNARRPFV